MSLQTEISFFNSINLSGPSLVQAREGCNRQENRIIELMPVGVKLTPLQVWDLYNEKYPATVPTSIRRAITVLTDRGELIMHDEMKMERYGKPNHVWSKK